MLELTNRTILALKLFINLIPTYLCLIMPFIDFSSILLEDEVVKDYSNCANKIYKDFIYPDKIANTLYFGQVGAFPLMIVIRDR